MIRIDEKIDEFIVIDKPWPHSVLDDFLPTDVLETITGMCISHIGSDMGSKNFVVKHPLKYKEIVKGEKKPVGGYNNELHKNIGDYIDSWQETVIKNKILSKFYEDFWDEESVRKRHNISTPDDLCATFQLRGFQPGFDYKSHTDMTVKYISIIIFIYPEEKSDLVSHPIGTVLYSPIKDKLGKKRYSYYGTINWKKNRAFVMAPKSNVTWHSYHVPHYMEEPRCVLMINIMPWLSEELKGIIKLSS